MRVKTKNQKVLLNKLDRLAGDPGIVDDALKALTAKRGRPPTLRELMIAVVRRRMELERPARARTA